MSSASLSFSVVQSGVDRLLHTPSGPLGQRLTRIGNATVNGAKRRANVRTGYMRSRIEFELREEGGRLVAYVVARTDYSAYVHRINPFLTDALAEALAAL